MSEKKGKKDARLKLIIARQHSKQSELGTFGIFLFFH